jgi:hypothetical protein
MTQSPFDSSSGSILRRLLAAGLLMQMLAGPTLGQTTNLRVAAGRPGHFGPCNPGIAINPKRPNHMVMVMAESTGSNGNPDARTMRNQVYLSEDFGRNWRTRRLSSRYGDFGHPGVLADEEGTYYYFHLSDPQKLGWESRMVLDRVVCQKSLLLGRWSRGSSIGHNPPRQQDKASAVFDEHSGRLYVTWTQHSKYGSFDPLDSAHILFAYSNDRGRSWTPAVRINQFGGNCQDQGQTPAGAMPAVGPNGTVYAAWAYNEKIYFDRSSDGGLSWLRQDVVAAEQPGGWAFGVPGIGRTNGLPTTACDLSYGPYHGNIYISWTDQRNGSHDTDVWLVRSTDGGRSWSEPLRVNDDGPTTAGAHQFMSRMAVDPITGIIYIVFYDRRNSSSLDTEVYLAVSNDGGQSFNNQRISERPFVPAADRFIGNYIGLAVYGNYVRPVWTRLDDGVPSIWTALLDFR